MFAIVESHLLLAPEESELSHTEWLINEGVIKDENDNDFNEIVRGMIDTLGNIIIYKGKDFSYNDACLDTFVPLMPELVDKLQLDIATPIWGGVTIGEPGKQWPPKFNLGIISDYVKGD